MTGLLIGLGIVGAALLATGATEPHSGHRRAGPAGRLRAFADNWLQGAGVHDTNARAMLGATALLMIVAGAAGFAVFGGVLPAVVVGLFAGVTPLAAQRQRRRHRLSVADDSWPQMIDEIRIMITSAGRPIPQALLDVGCRGPVELRDAFEAARREWALSTDFDRTVEVLTTQLGSPVADATCETLLVAHGIGSTDLDRRLAELAEDRRHDNLARKEARAKQAGVRFARRFVIIVPLGMAAAGLSLGNGRAAYQSPTGQTLVVIALALVAACWWWSGRILRLPEEQRVLT